MREQAVDALKSVVRTVMSQERALDNARRAATQLSVGRVEREEVEIFLAQRRGPDATAQGAAQPQVSATRR